MRLSMVSRQDSIRSPDGQIILIHPRTTENRLSFRKYPAAYSVFLAGVLGNDDRRSDSELALELFLLEGRSLLFRLVMDV